MARIDVLQADAANPFYSFTVDNTVIQVPIAAPGGDQTLYTASGAYLLRPVDNCRLIGFGLHVPHGYLWGDTPFEARLNAVCIDTGGSVTQTVAEVGAFGEAFIENPNIEQDFKELEIPMLQYHELREFAVGHLDTVYFTVEIIGGQISMLNSPDIMNGVVVPVLPYIVVKHNFILGNIITPA